MAQKDLIPFNQLTEEEQKKLASKGGKASVVARRKKKTMKEQLDILLNLPIKNEKVRKTLTDLGLEDDEMNNQMALLIAQYQKALKGDTQAFNAVRDTNGQQIANKVEIDQVPIINDDIK